MIEPVTIDASVFVNAFSPTEVGSDNSLAFIEKMQKDNLPIIAPTLLITEIAAAIARKKGDSELAISIANQVANLPNLMLIDLDKSLARLAAETAAAHKLRASDAVYVAVSLRFGTTLVTLDREQLERFDQAVSPQ
ncbi:MAG: type II toxin-antitoxin system VapC family toxin [Anaerolineae bacterium]|nr:type II toxin-antitoxin system VapC family toxin [Anaerolineae bacterium]